MKTTRALVALWLLTLCPLVFASELTRVTDRFPELPPPPQGSTYWIAKSMRMNGVPMTIRSLRSSLAPDAVLHFYESWCKQRTGAESLRTRIENDEALTIKVDRHLITIRAQRAASGTHGTITSSLASFTATAHIESAFPVPPTIRLVNLQQYEDESGEAEHLSFVSQRAPHVEASALAQWLGDKGWTTLRHAPMRETKRGYVIESQKGAQHAQLTIVPSEGWLLGSRILIVWKKA